MIRQVPLLVFSSLLFLLLGFTVTQKLFVPSESFGMLHGLFIAVNLTALFLSITFGRSTLFLLLLLFLGLAALTEIFDYLRHFGDEKWLSTPVGVMLDFAINFFAPPLIALLSWWNNRALLSLAGVLRWGSLLFLLLMIAYWVNVPNALPLVALSNLDVLFLPDIGISHVLLLLWVLSIGFLFFFIVIQQHYDKSIFFIALFGVLLSAALPSTLDYFLYFTALFSLLAIFFIISHSYYMAYIDELTGIKGRRAMNEALVRLSGRYSIAMVDIDHFKKFNDTYGHDIGDEVLKLVALEINKVEGGGEAFRWGGEEFAIIFKGKSAKDAYSFADKVRMGVEAHPFYLRSPDRPDEKPESTDGKDQSEKIKKIHITVSIGIGERTKDDLDPMDVMKKADDLLYVAKESGRNCVKL